MASTNCGRPIMKQINDFGDYRALLQCAFCGGKTGTRDHCPSRVLLDEPLPAQLPVIPACSECNASFSLDEEYLACLIACSMAGSTEPLNAQRPKIARVLQEKPALRARLEASCVHINGRVCFTPEVQRVNRVVQKLAQGHVLYEAHELYPKPPDVLRHQPLVSMDNATRKAFETLEDPRVWPEVGSRAMQRMLSRDDLSIGGWIDVQPGRYRYHVSWGDGIEARIVIGEYLACLVRWND